jgi:GTP-binding protein Era
MPSKRSTNAFQPGPGFRSGYVMLLGRPNVGKSTILNAIMGAELAIVTPKPQTTRSRIAGIRTTAESQIIFLDAPGVVESERGLNNFLKREVQAALNDANAVIFVIEAAPRLTNSEQEIIERLNRLNRPVVLAINKIDLVDKRTLLPQMEHLQTLFPFRAIVPISARGGDGVDRLVAEAAATLPEGPLYFPPDQITEATERFLVAEMVREQVFLLTKQEIPYSSAVLIEQFKDEGGLVRIAAEIFVERDSQKGILIGKEGAMLKAIGTAARIKMEAFLAKKVFLELFVKVKKDWTRSESLLREMGYNP